MPVIQSLSKAQPKESRNRICHPSLAPWFSGLTNDVTTPHRSQSSWGHAILCPDTPAMRRAWAVLIFLQFGATLNAQSLFNRHVRLILEEQCQACHSGASRQSGLEVATREELLRGGDHGPAIVPGKP